MKIIIFILGTRPEAIKLAPVINYFKNKNKKFKVVVLVTAQHRHMLDQVLRLFGIEPDYDLDLMTTNQTLSSLTVKIMEECTKIFSKIVPDLIMVQGDTTTTFAASIAAYYNKIPIAHIEAGLRTKNIYSPFPEEVNRRITSIVSKYHFAPTKSAQNNLISEGFKKENIFITGNTVIDSLLKAIKSIEKNKLNAKFDKIFQDKYGINFSTNKKTLMVTGHRRENFGPGVKNICSALKHLALNNNIQIIYPVHLNPNVEEPVFQILKNQKNIFLIPPLEYEHFIYLMNKSFIVLTDSGGVQEEAPSLGKPILVMRDNTERPEGVAIGTAILVVTQKNKIIKNVEKLLIDKELYNKMSSTANPYGDGNASKRIFDVINSHL